VQDASNDRTDWLVARFEADRPRLRAIAGRMLGSRSEADDVLQDAWVRVSGADVGEIDNLAGWFTTVVSRLALDRLRSRRARPVVSGPHDEHAATGEAGPAEQAELAEAVGGALVVVLDALTPPERIAFVLHDVFAVPFDEVGRILDRSPEATRQLASRARRRVRGVGSRSGAVDPAAHRRVVTAFLRAAQSGDLAGLLGVLHPDVALRPDAAALRMGALRPTSGADAVAQALAGGARAAQLAVVDGFAALVWAPGGHVRGVVEFVIVDDRIVAIDVIGDGDRIARRELVLL
jgi:RNA polymerase sigma-70 factor (ECF subfamily)